MVKIEIMLGFADEIIRVFEQGHQNSNQVYFQIGMWHILRQCIGNDSFGFRVRLN